MAFHLHSGNISVPHFTCHLLSSEKILNSSSIKLSCHESDIYECISACEKDSTYFILPSLCVMSEHITLHMICMKARSGTHQSPHHLVMINIFLLTSQHNSPLLLSLVQSCPACRTLQCGATLPESQVTKRVSSLFFQLVIVKFPIWTKLN